MLLNHSPVFLRGLTDHAYFPETCTVPTSYGFYERTLKILKSIGFNWIRFHTWCPPEECLEAADRLGMLLQVEAPNGFKEQDWLDILYTCRKHPSVIIYCCGNEVRLEDEVIDYLEIMSEHCRAMAPDCLFSPMEGLQKVEYGLDKDAPGYVPGPFPYNKRLLEKLNRFSDVYAPHGSIFSYQSVETDEAMVQERLKVHDRPCLMHEMGINDSYLNLDLELRYENTRIGTDLFRLTREYLGRMGVLQNAALYYQNSCKWQRDVFKFGMEQSRQSERISGYDLLGAIDCHWHRTGYAVGLLNEFYEPKAGLSLEEVIRYNGESVLLVQIGQRRNFIAGQRVKMPVKASLFSGSKATDGKLSWRLADLLGKVYFRGSKSVTGLEYGRIANLGEIEIEFPRLDAARHMKLHARLSCDDLEIENSWDVWMFPEVRANELKDSVRIIHRLDDETLEYLQKGGRAVLIGAKPFPALPTTFQIMSGGRTRGNSATVVHEHPLTRAFPHEGYCSWQFYSMLKEGQAVLFNDLSLPFEPIVEMVSSYKLVRKQAVLFELKVGLGGLVVCSLNMDSSDPGAAFLKESIIKYISGDEFSPRTEASTEELRELISSAARLDVDFSTDEGFDESGHVL